RHPAERASLPPRHPLLRRPEWSAGAHPAPRRAPTTGSMLPRCGIGILLLWQARFDRVLPHVARGLLGTRQLYARPRSGKRQLRRREEPGQLRRPPVPALAEVGW